MALDTIDNFGLPFAGSFLVNISIFSPKFGTIPFFPQNPNTFKGGQTVIKNMKITESLFSPIVHGSIVMLDIGNVSDNLNLEGFEEIKISFRRNIPGDIILFTGIVTQYTVLTDDAEHTTDMNANEKTRVIQLDFMNKDIFMANSHCWLAIPKNDLNQTNFLAWIADDGTRT